jgi:hypothetical protein
MKKLFIAACLSFIVFSCTDTKKQEKDLFTEVVKVHDQVMGKEELIMINKMQLDTIIKKRPEVAAQASAHSKALDSVDTRMENWMHNFDAENKGKSHNEIMSYLTEQQKQINAIDSSLNIAVAAASKFVKQNKAQ